MNFEFFNILNYEFFNISTNFSTSYESVVWASTEWRLSQNQNPQKNLVELWNTVQVFRAAAAISLFFPSAFIVGEKLSSLLG